MTAPIHIGRHRTDKPCARDGSKTLSQIDRDTRAWADQQTVLTRCSIWGCEWTHEGAAAEGREAFLAHRKAEHPTADRIARNEQARQVSGREPKAGDLTVPLPSLPLPSPSPAPEAEAGSRPEQLSELKARAAAQADRYAKRARAFRMIEEGLSMLQEDA